MKRKMEKRRGGGHGPRNAGHGYSHSNLGRRSKGAWQGGPRPPRPPRGKRGDGNRPLLSSRTNGGGDKIYMYGKHALAEALTHAPQTVRRVFLSAEAQNDPTLRTLLAFK
jgi:hypothetical protein